VKVSSAIPVLDMEPPGRVYTARQHGSTRFVDAASRGVLDQAAADLRPTAQSRRVRSHCKTLNNLASLPDSSATLRSSTSLDDMASSAGFSTSVSRLGTFDTIWHKPANRSSRIFSRSNRHRRSVGNELCYAIENLVASNLVAMTAFAPRFMASARMRVSATLRASVSICSTLRPHLRRFCACWRQDSKSRSARAL